ncbi:hypothetical protein GCM10028817_25030 [Spirosoma pomorum]
MPNDVAARASGRYTVLTYCINGDTLYSSKGVNKISVSEFYIVVDRKKSDSVRVGSAYKRNGDVGVAIHIKDVGVSESNGVFQLSAGSRAPALYESKITANTFYERSVNGAPGVVVVPLGYSFKTPSNPSQEGIIISAQK